jgi:hypothetical protein
MGFWGAQGGAIVDPKRQFRWLVSFGNSKLKSWYAKSAKKPSFQIGETPHQFINHTFYYPGRVEWQTVDITLVDPAGADDTSLALAEMLRNMGYYAPINDNSASSTITKKKAVNALGGEVKLKQIGANDSETLEIWTLINPWIQNVEFGQLAYDSNEMVEISLTLRYDYAILTANGVTFPHPLA